MTVKHDCSEEVWHKIGFYHCLRLATVERDGKWYCWQHDPERVKAEAKKRRVSWQAKMDREDAKYARIARNARLGALVTPELVALLERLAEIMPAWGDGAIHRADLDEAHALAARIREALALEVNE